MSCKKDEPTPTTSLQITAVTSVNGNEVRVNNAQVTLSESIPGTGNRVVGMGTTDANGVIIFDGLKPVTYIWQISKDCLSNNIQFLPGAVRDLQAGVRNYYTTNVGRMGHLKITNNSNENYVVYTYVNQLIGYLVNPQSSLNVYLEEGPRTIYYHKEATPTVMMQGNATVLCPTIAAFVIQ